MYKVTVVVFEGKKRMVRRLFAHLNLHVLDLSRIAYGDVTLGGLGVGEFRVVGGAEEGRFVNRCLEGGKGGGEIGDIGEPLEDDDDKTKNKRRILC